MSDDPPDTDLARGLQPVADARARVLVLGSFPGRASLTAGHYYAHPRNQFWPLMSAVLGEELVPLDWPARYARLRDRHVALWDVIEACERPGSLDANIRQASANDLDALLAGLPELRRIVFNGGTAGRHARRFADAGFEVQVLPSSSPAHAALNFERKRDRWVEAFRGVMVLPERAGAAAYEQASEPETTRPPLRARRHRPVEVPITLSEEGGVRFLHFGSMWVQGAMLISHPNVLVLDYVQRMMTWLMFLSPPARILQLGLGAGSLTRFTHARLLDSHTTVIECSRDVIDVARACFALPADDDRLSVRCDDAGRFIARRAEAGKYGVVQVDLYDADARGPVLDSDAFYQDCRRVLAQPGICVVNLFGSHRSFAPNIARLSKAFGGRILVMPATPAGNRIVLGFAGPPLRIEWAALEQRARWLEQRFGWPAIEWAQLLRTRSRRAVCAV
ncbi:MAG TPA: DNA-deoxyinosine glycosylase [Burkholderiaceae bacterium]|nr:DNA-deoxyinosine glycosylase [Burkholderiaceae bacterium]